MERFALRRLVWNLYNRVVHKSQTVTTVVFSVQNGKNTLNLTSNFSANRTEITEPILFNSHRTEIQVSPFCKKQAPYLLSSYRMKRKLQKNRNSIATTNFPFCNLWLHKFQTRTLTFLIVQKSIRKIENHKNEVALLVFHSVSTDLTNFQQAP